jgi:hypothetical protein
MQGILLQGSRCIWTKDIILSYKNSMPNSIVMLSTWDDEDTSDLCDICEIVKTKKPNGYNIHFQKTGSLEGLKRLNCQTILKCRTDQYIDAPYMFNMFRTKVRKSKILISNYTTLETMDYFASDFCQLAERDVLLNFWNSIDENVGAVNHPEQHLTKCYILNYWKDRSAWKNALRRYFHVADFNNDWKIKWLKLDTLSEYKLTYKLWFPKCVKISSDGKIKQSLSYFFIAIFAVLTLLLIYFAVNSIKNGKS